MISMVQFKKQWNGASQIIEPVHNDLAKSYKGVVNFFTVMWKRNAAYLRGA